MRKPFLHDTEYFKDLIEITARQEGIKDPALVEKDYWIMHLLWGLRELEFEFYLKGGTSLSKGYGCIYRFSEDIDIKITPDEALCKFKVYNGKNHDKEAHCESRKHFYDWIAAHLKNKIPGIIDIKRDKHFDEKKFRSGGVRLFYKSYFAEVPGLKQGILLELGFDRTAPNQPRLISSWAYDSAKKVPDFAMKDNRAVDVPCYDPKYTFVEKLQAVVRKFKQYKEDPQGEGLPANFLRHYYDLYQLIEREDVQAFIGTPEYQEFKVERFGGNDTKVANSDAFRLSDPRDRELFQKEYSRSEGLYFKGRPSLDEILTRIGADLLRL